MVDNWGLPQSKSNGFCRVCTRLEPMTFEHLPPKVAGNDSTVRSVPYEVWHGHDNIREFPRTGWTQQQKGTGGYVLCASCNSLTGRRWAPEYGRWAKAARQVLAVTGAWREPPPGARWQVHYGMKDIYPGRFVRQALTMLLAVSGGPTTAAQHPETARIVLDGTAGLPGGLRIFMDLYAGPHIRLLPVTGSMNLQTRRHEISVEVAFPPFALVAVLDGEPREDDYGLEITDWCEWSPDRCARIEIQTTVGYGYTPFLGDYRPVNQVEMEAAA